MQRINTNGYDLSSKKHIRRLKKEVNEFFNKWPSFVICYKDEILDEATINNTEYLEFLIKKAISKYDWSRVE